MTHPTASQATASEPIAAAIDQLRHLTQVSIQTGWRACAADLPVDQATQAQVWPQWNTVSLNDRGHIAWPKGRQVLWLGQRLLVPAALRGYPLSGLSLRLAVTWWAEAAQLFVNGELVQEGDLFDCSTRLWLSPAVQPGETIDLAIRLVSPGHDQGALVRSLCLYEHPAQAVQPSPEPGFVADELAVLHLYLSCFQPEKLPQLLALVASIPWSLIPDRPAFDRAIGLFRQGLEPLARPLKQSCIQLLGHAHLDLAWLWPIQETWEAAERTFRSVLQLQQEFPELIFCHSTPALYAWIEEHCPALFAEIQAQVAAERWEVVAGLWLEPELNLISGESIARHVLYGQRYVQQKFGQPSRVAWLPDTFGFCWQLPQILKQGGIDYFVTQKLRWNDTTEFPHDAFWWQSPDGTQIFSLHSAPIGEGIDPVKMAQYSCIWQAKTGSPLSLWLPGVGDHGGGPSRDMLELARRWQQSPCFPRLEFSSAHRFLDSLVKREQPIAAQEPSLPALRSTSNQSAAPFPVWNDELYLEFHRGCYTSHADQKRWNRRCEALLYAAELFSSIATLATAAAYPAAELEVAWKRVLFNQFHDILPGSAIAAVYEDANRAWQEAEATGEALIRSALQAIAAQIALPPPPASSEAKATSGAIAVFNPLSWSRSEVVTVHIPASETACDRTAWQVVDLQGQPIATQHCTASQITFLAEEIPAVGYRCFWICPLVNDALPLPAPDPLILENEFLRVTVDPNSGDLSSVFDKQWQREVLSGPGNQLQAFHDAGQYWDAWNIDPNYASHPLPPAELLSIRSGADAGLLDHSIQVKRKLGKSVFEQTYRLHPGLPLLTIATRVDWRERHILVKAAFPLTLEADYATYEIPYGAIARSTRRQSDRETAQWEVPALSWADLGDGTYGVSLLSDSKQGYDAQPNQLRLTLLRGSEWPDPHADTGHHQFTYALYPHAGSWRTAQTVRRGYELNHPIQVLRLNSSSLPSLAEAPPAGLPPVAQVLSLPENVVLSALKPAEDNPQQWIVRCYECCGTAAAVQLNELGLVSQWLEVNSGQLVDLVEANLAEPGTTPIGVALKAGDLAIASWKIVTCCFPQRTT